MTKEITATVAAEVANALAEKSKPIDWHEAKTESKSPIDFSKYVTPTERGKNADNYLMALRANDRL